MRGRCAREGAGDSAPALALALPRLGARFLRGILPPLPHSARACETAADGGAAAPGSGPGEAPGVESSPRSEAWMTSLPRGWSVTPLRAGVEKV